MEQILRLKKHTFRSLDITNVPFCFFPSLEAAMNGRASKPRTKEASGAKASRNSGVRAMEANRARQGGRSELRSPVASAMPRSRRHLG